MQKTLIFDALLLGKAGFLMTRQRGAKMLHYYMKSRFSRDAPKPLYLMHLYVKKHVFS